MRTLLLSAIVLLAAGSLLRRRSKLRRSARRATRDQTARWEGEGGALAP